MSPRSTQITLGLAEMTKCMQRYSDVFVRPVFSMEGAVHLQRLFMMTPRTLQITLGLAENIKFMERYGNVFVRPIFSMESASNLSTSLILALPSGRVW